MKKVLCYFGLFFLIILLLIPPGLRIFAKNLYPEEEKPKLVVNILNCNKETESVFSSYANTTPQTFQYKIKGNYVLNNENNSNVDTEENLDGVIQTNEPENELIHLIRKNALVTYDEESDLTTYQITFWEGSDYTGDLRNFKDMEKIQKYLIELKFSCTTSSY